MFILPFIFVIALVSGSESVEVFVSFIYAGGDPAIKGISKVTCRVFVMFGEFS